MSIEKKGSCMWCAETFVQGHKCLRSQLYQLFVRSFDDATQDENADYFDEYSDKQVIYCML